MPTATDMLDSIRLNYRTKRVAIIPEISIDVPGETGAGLRRIDALMFDGFERTAFEIKVNRADVMRETYAKTDPWMRVVHRYIYVMPEGLIEPRDMPANTIRAGVWWIPESGGFPIIKRKCSINKNPEPLPYNVVRRLGFRAAGVKIDV